MSNLTKHLDRYDASSLLALEKALGSESKRRAAATSLISFTEYTYPRYQAGSIHHQIAEQLERVARDEVDRLMILVPPRHGKSELASRRFPAWYLGRHPDKQFISASASFALAEDFGRDVRNLMFVRHDALSQVSKLTRAAALPRGATALVRDKDRERPGIETLAGWKVGARPILA